MKSKRRWLLLLPVLALFAWAYQAASWRPKLIGVQPSSDPNTPITRAKLLISPDGKRMISFEDKKGDRSLVMWTLASRQNLWQQKPSILDLMPLAFSPDSRFLAASELNTIWLGRPDETLYLLDTATGQHRRKILPVRSWGYLESAAFLSPTKLVVSSNKFASVVDTPSGRTIRQWKFNLTGLASTKRAFSNQSHVSADGTTILALANGTHDTAVAIYDAATGKQRASWTYKTVARNPRLSPDGKLWAMQQESSNLFDVYDAKTGKKLWGAFASTNEEKSWSWSADSRQIWTTPGAMMAVVNARTGADIKSVPGRGDFQSLALDSRAGFYYTLDNTGKIWRWRLR